MTVTSAHLPAAVGSLVERALIHDPAHAPLVHVGQAARGTLGGRQMFVLSDRKRPRMLLPLEGTAAARGLVTAGPGLRSPRERLARSLVGAALATGIPQRLTRNVVVLDQQVGPDLLDALRVGWTPRVAAIGFSVRQITPNHKPTFIAVDGRGHVLGYGKMGWDRATRTRVAVEARLLRTLAADPVAGLGVAPLLAELDWQGRNVIIVQPLPASARRFPRAQEPPLVLAERARAGGQHILLGTRAEILTKSIDATRAEDISAALLRCRDRVTGRWGDLELPVGLTHGDWVPWNVATCRASVWAWDWEYGQEQDVPALDLVHWHLQVARLVRHLPLIDAVAPALQHASVDCLRVGLPADSANAVCALGVMQLAVRTLELAQPDAVLRAELVQLLDGVR